MSESQSMRSEAERLFESATDALSDDIVGRLGSTVGDGLVLLDQVNRSNIDKAIPVLDDLVENGDLERAANLIRVLGAAGDALSDDIVARLGEAVGEGLGLLDKVNRSNLDKAIPVIDQLVESGDLDRAANMVRVLGSAGDALSDDIVGRLGELVNSMLIIADRISRNNNLNKLLDLLERDDLINMLTSLCEATEAAKATYDEPTSGGIKGLMTTMKDPEVQQALRFMSRVSSGLKNS
ncbi:MAG: DUF1641 domain-containing protein [Granulosicoccus sp.]|nr:DUF1641 domain-containing protein [Granulosicoccus sp.]